MIDSISAMSETNHENFENEGGAPAPDPADTPAAPAAPEAPAGWKGPSEEEWTGLVNSNRQMNELITSLFEEEEETFDPGQIDMSDPQQAAYLMDQIVAGRMGEITPFIQNAAKEQGGRKMEEMFSHS